MKNEQRWRGASTRPWTPHRDCPRLAAALAGCRAAARIGASLHELARRGCVREAGWAGSAMAGREWSSSGRWPPGLAARRLHRAIGH